MGLSDFDNDFEVADVNDAKRSEANTMPDGLYRLWIERVSEKDDCITVGMRVLDEGDYTGDLAMVWFNFRRGNLKITAARLKEFLVELNIPGNPSAFENMSYCEQFTGMVVEAVKKSNEKDGKIWPSWSKWECISKPERVDAEEIDLNEDPF